ncbi:endo alpha-1,4 polygalactosaminidase [Flavobacterium caeni]|uniref:Extracellular protein n=1 Tax=Flavobacterium caeni TaxID=490189 RepID=A0A1G5D4Q1_9FLAO|nr:endo alpha-1,4 polygalactosaminidase [Flavobacterium caeni]SCY09632.1 extracellular protein [Flavobacterium caeni]
MRLTKFFLFVLPSVLLTNLFASGTKKNTVLVCYGKLKAESIKGYGYVILEAKHYTAVEVKQIKSQNEKVFAYMSLGEVNAHAAHYKALKNHTLGKNEIWNSYYLNLKAEKTSTVLMDIINKALAKGYDGMFLDNIDNYSIYGPQKDQRKELVTLLRNIKEKYPKNLFIQNAALELVPETSAYIDAVAIESVASLYNFKTKQYGLRDAKQFEETMTRLKNITTTHKVPVIVIEYADTQSLYNKIIERIKPSGFQYFIGNIDLQRIPNFK